MYVYSTCIDTICTVYSHNTTIYGTPYYSAYCVCVCVCVCVCLYNLPFPCGVTIHSFITQTYVCTYVLCVYTYIALIYSIT